MLNDACSAAPAQQIGCSYILRAASSAQTVRAAAARAGGWVNEINLPTDADPESETQAAAS